MGGPTGFRGSPAVLAAHAEVLPQPDQLCGPFSAYVALHALGGSPPPLVSLAVAAGTTVWPHEVSTWRPPEAVPDRTGWERLPTAGSAETCGTQAAGLAIGLGAVAGVAVVPVPGGDRDATERLLSALTRAGHPVGVLAHVRTGPIAPAGLAWDAGHFVVLHGFEPDTGLVGVADTYPELGAPGQPPGCRTLVLDDLVAALRAEPGRGLLLLVRADDETTTRELVTSAGLTVGLWSA